jgi:hypothetical protein
MSDGVSPLKSGLHSGFTVYSKCTGFFVFSVFTVKALTFCLTECPLTHTHTHTHTRTGSKYTVHVPEILRTSSSSSPSSLVHVQPSRSGEPAPVSMRRSQQQPAPLSRILTPDAPYVRAPYLRAVAAEEDAAGTAAVAAAVATAKAVSQMRHMPGYTSHLKRRCAQEVDAAL